MRKRNKFAVVIAALFALAFFLAAPVMDASAPGGATNSQIHFTQSPDCYVLGFGPGQGIGTYYFDGALGIGCGPLVV